MIVNYVTPKGRLVCRSCAPANVPEGWTPVHHDSRPHNVEACESCGRIAPCERGQRVKVFFRDGTTEEGEINYLRVRGGLVEAISVLLDSRVSKQPYAGTLFMPFNVVGA